jgi:hypothetical protein
MKYIKYYKESLSFDESDIKDILIDLDLIDIKTHIRLLDRGLSVQFWRSGSSLSREYHSPDYDEKSNKGFKIEEISDYIFHLKRTIEKEFNFDHIFIQLNKINKDGKVEFYPEIYIDLKNYNNDLINEFKRRNIHKIDNLRFVARKS